MAGELTVGETIMTRNGAATLTQRRHLPGLHRVWNLEVRGWHNYLVGEKKLVAHNGCIVFEGIDALKDAVENVDLRNCLINDKIFIDADWIRDLTPTGAIYRNPLDLDGDFYRFQKAGSFPNQTHNYGKPYVRRYIRDSNGDIINVDLDGNPGGYEATHVLLENISKFTDD